MTMDKLKAWVIVKPNFENVFRKGTAVFMVTTFITAVVGLGSDSKSPAHIIVTSLFFIIVGLIGAVYCLVYMTASWSLEEDEFYELITTTSIMGDAWYNKFSKSYWLWNHRILSIPGLLMGLLALFVGSVRLWQYVF